MVHEVVILQAQAGMMTEGSLQVAYVSRLLAVSHLSAK